MAEKLVSVIITTYNCRFLERAVRSTLVQTYPNLEIIVVDDGSSVVQKFPAVTKIAYYKLPHSGLPAVARNFGIRKAQGDFIAMLDADDYWLPEKIEAQLKFLKRFPQISLCCSQAYITGSKRKYLSLESNQSLDFRRLLKENYIVNSSALWSKSLVKAIGFLDENPLLKAQEDYEFWLRILASGRKIFFLDQPLLCYTRNNEGLSKTIPLDKKIAGRRYLAEKFNLKEKDFSANPWFQL